MLALKEWHVAAEAIARGDQVVTLRKGGIREKEFAVRGSRFWLFPTWEHENEAQVKPAWRTELRRSLAERRADGRIPIRCRCTVAAAWELSEPEALETIDGFHLWTPAYAEERLSWRPRKPLSVLLLRAEALVEPVLLDPDAAYGGCRSWLELEAAPSEADLLPSLTDDAFELHAARVRSLLGPASELPAGVAS